MMTLLLFAHLHPLAFITTLTILCITFIILAFIFAFVVS